MLKTDNLTLVLTNRQKIFWPEHGYTKGDLLDYYRDIAPVIVQYLKGRPLANTAARAFRTTTAVTLLSHSKLSAVFEIQSPRCKSGTFALLQLFRSPPARAT